MSRLRSSVGGVLTSIQDFGLVLIAIASVIALYFEFSAMFDAKIVTLADLLLLFIYLEVLSMVVVYLNSGKLPVRIPLYIAMVALARYLILDMKNMDNWRLLGVSGAILIVTLAVLALRYGHTKYPYDQSTDAG